MVMTEEDLDGSDWEVLRGHFKTKRLLELAAAGFHSIVLVGPKDSDKAALARSLLTIMPTQVPFLAPCPSPDSVARVVEQATGGIVFLEDLERWEEPSLVVLRKTCWRSPGQFLLVATTGYCPCGNDDDAVRDCSCFVGEIDAHQKRLRQTIDACFAIEAHIPSVNPDLAARWGNESSRIVRARVEAARLIQQQRNGAARLNSALSRTEVEECSPLDTLAQKLLAAAQAQLSLSAEQECFLLQVARTAAHLACEYRTVSYVEGGHLAEAICSRPRWTAGRQSC